MNTIHLQCDCGRIKGEVRHVAHANCNHLVCYCNDCQEFPRHLGKAGNVLNSWGGTEIVQIPQAWLDITEGADLMRCIRFGKKGIYRWYAGCCNAPIGNTLGPGWPFIGIIHSFIRPKGELADAVGPSRGNVWVEFAAPGAPDDVRKHASAFRLLFRTLRLMLAWKVKGLHQPSAFFSFSGQPVADPEVLSL
jgi:hypothetical protein